MSRRRPDLSLWTDCVAALCWIALGCRSPSRGSGAQSVFISSRASDAAAVGSRDVHEAGREDAALGDSTFGGQSNAASGMNFLARICATGALTDRSIQRGTFADAGAHRADESMSFNEMALSFAQNAEPDVFITLVGERRTEHSVLLAYRNRPEFQRWEHVAFVLDPEFTYWRFGVLAGSARVQLWDPYLSHDGLGRWFEWRRFALVPLRSRRVQVFVQCEREVRSRVLYVSRRAPRWCTVPVPDELQAMDGGARIPCLRWQSEHPMTE
jgi:hypothetical protein